MRIKRVNELFKPKLVNKFKGSVGDWIFLHEDHESEYFGEQPLNNKLGQIMSIGSTLSIKLVEGPQCIFQYSNKIRYEIVDKSIVQLFESGKLLPLIKSNKLNLILNEIKFKFKSFFNDCSYFDVTDKNGEISMLPMSKYKDKNEWTTKNRQPIKIGKIFKKLNPDLTDKEIETYVNLYKAKYDIIIKHKNLKIVKGEEIRHWYLEDNYAKGGGSLNNSCMRYKRSQKRFDLYCNNPDKIGLLILTDDNNKLLARSLIWYLDRPKNKIFIDIIYAVNDYYCDIFYDYAKENGFKTEDDVTMKVKIKKEEDVDIEDYPYMDTFKYYFYKKGILSNESDAYEYEDYANLNDHD